MNISDGRPLTHHDPDRLIPVGDAGWCAKHDETLDAWERLGGIPDHPSTIEHAVHLLFALRRRHRELERSLDQLLETSP